MDSTDSNAEVESNGGSNSRVAEETFGLEPLMLVPITCLKAGGTMPLQGMGWRLQQGGVMDDWKTMPVEEG